MRTTKYIVPLALALAIGATSAACASGRSTLIPRDREDDFAGVEVLTRGPVHEAFAASIIYDTEPGLLASTAPPEPIDELPPDQGPDGDNVDWIPGYWAWDDERDDYLWISGVWRVLPPGRQWVPGYWARSGRGYQWTSGYWADADASEIEYLPEPPATVEIGPNVAPPSAEHSWIPGSWVWHERRYAWRPGCWVVVEPDWDWIPSYYVWAPRGYVFVDGYWDRPVSRRGVLFAPVHFAAAVQTRRGYVYSPTTVINVSVFSDHLFVRPRYNHYYFGDYYAPTYRESGFFASFTFQSSRRGYDPIVVRDRWQHRQDPDWDRRVEANFNLRRDREEARPRRTLSAQVSYTSNESRRGDRSFALAASVEQVSRSKDNAIRLRPIDRDERQSAAQRGKEVQRFREDRRQREDDAADASVERRGERSEPIRMKAQRSPIAAKSANQLDKREAPPRKPEQPRPDPKVERKPKKKDGEKRGRPE